MSKSIRRFALTILLHIAATYPVAAQDSAEPEDSLGLDSLLNIEISAAAKRNQSANGGSAAVTAAAKYKQSARDAPASVTIITSDDILIHGYQTLEDILQMVRGVYVSNDRNYSYLGVRGFSRPTDYNDRIVLLLNGHSLNENVYGSALLGTELALDLDHVARIEVIRGPGSALYGTNAMFAVINVVTRDGNAVDGARVRAEAGSCGRVGGAVEAGRRSGNGLDWTVSGMWGDVRGQTLYFPEYDDPATNNGLAANNDWDRYYGLVAAAGYKRFSVQGAFSDRTKAVPTGSYETVFDDDDARTEDRRGFVELKYDSPWGDNRQFMGRLYYDNYFYAGTYPYEIDQSDDSRGDWIGAEAQYRWDPRADNRLVVGVEHQNNLHADYTQWDADTVYFEGEFPFTLWSAYIQDEAQLTRSLSVTAGIRHDYNSTVGSTTTPRGAIVFSPPRLGTLKLMFGEAYRAPNVFEREIGGGNLVKGNPNLQPERIRTYELAWEYRLKRGLRGVLSLYHYDMHDLIDPTVDPADSLTVYTNVGRASARGAEVELDGYWSKGTSMAVSYSYQEATDSGTDEPITNSPQHAAKLVGVLPIGKHLTLAARGLYESRRLTVYDTWTKPYFIAGLTTTVRPRLSPASPWGTVLARASLVLTVNNIFDAEYQTPGGLEHRQPAIMQNGRNMLLKLRFEL